MSDTPVYKAKREDLSRLAQYWTRDGLGVLTGTASIFPLAHSWIALFLATNYQVHVIDCAIRFNVYRLIEEGNLLSLDIHKLLMTGKVQRAFTPYQILDACHCILKETPNPNKVYFILAPCKQFFDGDVKEQEGYFLLNKLITVFADIQEKGIPFLAVESPKYKSKTFQLLFPILLDLANTKWKYDKLLLGREVFQRFQVYSKNSFIKNIEYELENSKGEEYGENSRALFNGN
ncbi:MAG: hypothetical protein KBF93_08445 [Leptospiraceae bacterium]|nr:hypothetical protein [Leptospiraceae bacterium]